jgi:asparagine synthase (glutamine-hydrolysing)
MFDGSYPAPQLLERMCDAMRHRGPDAAGYHVESGIALGQRRLSIIDLSDAATPPLTNETNRIWIAFNGEIYNFKELREWLQGRGHRFRTASDTEVIVHLYEEVGTDCLQRLRGMFAFALWDGERERFFAARDRLGKKPFFYAYTPSGLVFGSSIQAVLADPSISRDPDFAAIHLYLSRQYVPSPLTAFAAIRKLEPGHYLLWERGRQVESRAYWTPAPGNAEGRSEDELAPELLELLRESVRLRMVADVPLGALLSGGIDSGTVVALMAQESARPVKTFSIGLEETEMNELPFARRVAERYGTDHTELIVRPEMANVLPILVRHYGEPFADSSAIPTYYVSQLARRGVTVALSGDGGDEAFGGYEHYEHTLRWSKLDALPQLVRAAAVGPFERLFDLMPFTDATSKASRGLSLVRHALPQRYLIQTSIFKPQEMRAAYSPRFRSLIRHQSCMASQPALQWHPGDDPLGWMTRHDMRAYLPDCLMVKVDVAAMAHGLEVRCPLLDQRVVEFALTVPSRLKRHDGVGKLLLRKVAASLLPAEILTKPKTGFGIPLRKWLQEDLAAMMRNTLLDDVALRRDLFHRPFVRGLVDAHISGRRDWSSRLWALMVLELWFREFVD